MPTTSSARAPSHHVDHPELLLLDLAVSRVVEASIRSGQLTPSRAAQLRDFEEDALGMAAQLSGPARDYADGLVVLIHHVLDHSAASAAA